MEKGFTLKEFIIALIAFGIVLGITIPMIIRAYSSSEKTELINYSKLYIKRLNTQIIESVIDQEDKLYNVKLPTKKGETVTFSINSHLMENPYNYTGIIKVTYVSGNNYEYKIAIHNDNIMIGTESSPVDYNSLDENIIQKYNKKTFGN